MIGKTLLTQDLDKRLKALTRQHPGILASELPGVDQWVTSDVRGSVITSRRAG
jgi:hypothetical protein